MLDLVPFRSESTIENHPRLRGFSCRVVHGHTFLRCVHSEYTVRRRQLLMPLPDNCGRGALSLGLSVVFGRPALHKAEAVEEAAFLTVPAIAARCVQNAYCLKSSYWESMAASSASPGKSARSRPSRRASSSTVRIAAGTVPSRMRPKSARRMPVRMGWP